MKSLFLFFAAVVRTGGCDKAGSDAAPSAGLALAHYLGSPGYGHHGHGRGRKLAVYREPHVGNRG